MSLISPAAAFGSAWFLAKHRGHNGKSETEQKDARRNDGGVSEEENGECRVFRGLGENDLK